MVLRLWSVKVGRNFSFNTAIKGKALTSGDMLNSLKTLRANPKVNALPSKEVSPNWQGKRWHGLVTYHIWAVGRKLGNNTFLKFNYILTFQSFLKIDVVPGSKGLLHPYPLDM